MNTNRKHLSIKAPWACSFSDLSENRRAFKLSRLSQTLERIKNAGEIRTAASDSRITSLPGTPHKLMIRNRESISFVDMDEILLIQREDRSTVIYTQHDRLVTSEGLSELENRLGSDRFLRCHKSYIINLSAISKIVPYGRWTYVVKLKGTEKDALVTREKYEELEKRFR